MKATKEMSIVHIISASPLARPVLLKHGIKFIGKGLSPLESLEKVAKGNGLSDSDIEKILGEINSASGMTPSASVGLEKKGEVIELTESAAEKLKQIVRLKGKKGIRLRLVSDGCSTYVYDMDFATKRIGNEIEVKTGNVKFFVEQKTVDFIKGTMIDYNAEKEGFVFDNPNVKK